jgi:hypothetical protein
MKAVVILLSIVAFIACLIIGIQAGSKSLPTRPTTPSPTQGNWSSSSQQRTIVLIVADDLMAPKPQLFATWIVLYRPDAPRITFLPLYPPNTVTLTSNPPDLASNFTLDADKSPGQAFAESLQKFNFAWNGYILTDEIGITQTVDWLQGIAINGTRASGTAALSTLTNPWDDPLGALETQQALITNICTKVSALKPEANWLELAGLMMPQHLHTNLSLESALIDWKTLATAGEPITCEAPIQ